MADGEVDTGAKRAQELLDKLWNDKDVGAKIRAKAKEAYPDIVIPEDQIDPVVAPIKAQMEELMSQLQAEREERKTEREATAAAKTERDLSSALDAARNRFNLTDDGFDKMVARMKETGNYQDAEAAAAWVAQMAPPPPQPGPTWAPQKIDLFGKQSDEMLKLLHTDPEAYQDAMLTEFVQDPDKFVRESFGQAA